MADSFSFRLLIEIGTLFSEFWQFSNFIEILNCHCLEYAVLTLHSAILLYADNL